MNLEEALQDIRPADRKSMEEAKLRWRTVGKPLFSLGKLEDAVIRMSGIKGTASYTLGKKALVILCADNGRICAVKSFKNFIKCTQKRHYIKPLGFIKIQTDVIAAFMV